MTQIPILEIQNICKNFGGVKATNHVSFSIELGEVHAIVGENGAGKSTLMNILAGVYACDSGKMFLNGAAYAPASPREARDLGVSIVFQELALFPLLPLDANLFIGKEIMNGACLDHHAMREYSQKTIAQMGLTLKPDQQVGHLPMGQQQWVEIARAVADNAKVLILDEPNSALNQYETENLFDLIRRLKERGITIIYISHRLEEVFQIADRITVMRDGHYIGTHEIESTSISKVINEMIGREVNELFCREEHSLGEVVLEVKNLSVEGRLKPVSFNVRAGEVVGLVGLAGSGVTDIFEALFGVKQASQGEILLCGKPIKINFPLNAIQNKIAMVPADRRSLGLMLNWSVLKNITLTILNKLSRLGIIQHNLLKIVAQEYVNKLKIVTEDLGKGVIYLSGGNQQKVLLARWLTTEPRLLILDDPTRGIDVGAKQEIYQLIDKIAAEGVAVLFTSSEIEETLSLSDRVLVLRNGKMIAELPNTVCNKELVMEFAAGDVTIAIKNLEERQFHFGMYSTNKNIVASDLKHLEKLEQTKKIVTQENTPPTTEKKIPTSNWFTSTVKRVLQVREMGVLQALLLVILIFSFLTPHFLKLPNFLLISRQMSILAIIAVGMTFVLSSGEVDLSVGWIFNLTMSVMAVAMTRFGITPWLCIPLALLVGSLLGAVNGVLAVFLGLPSIIITLGTSTLFRGLSLALNKGHTIGNLPKSSFFQIGAGTFGSVPYMTIVMLVVVFLSAWLIRNTVFSRHLMAKGGNAQAASRLGIRTEKLRVFVMILNGLMCGLAAVLGLTFLGAADPQSGSGYEMSAMASAIIGGASLSGGSGSVWGTLIGIALITIIQNGLVLMGLRPAWQIASTGFVIIAAVTVDHFTKIRREKPNIKPK